MKEIITIKVSNYLTNELVEKIACMRLSKGFSPEWKISLLHEIYDGKTLSDCFYVIAQNGNDDVVEFAFFLRNQTNPDLWYYGNLVVSRDYRRNKIATKIIAVDTQQIIEIGGKLLRCYVEPQNIESISLQKSIGFVYKEFKTFDNLITDGQIMFQLNSPSLFTTRKATEADAVFVTMFYWQNIDSFHGGKISFDEWKEMLSKKDKDEENLLICKGAIPVAWLKINGLENKGLAWISMLAVSDEYQHQGIGTFAINFAEKYLLERGFSKISIHTAENILKLKIFTKSVDIMLQILGTALLVTMKNEKVMLLRKS